MELQQTQLPVEQLNIVPLSDRCVCCGIYVPEGRMVCPICNGDFEHRYEFEILINLLLKSSKSTNPNTNNNSKD